MNSDDLIEQWKQARQSEVPEPSSDFTDRILRRVETKPDTPISPLLWICRIALVILVTTLVAGRLIATAAVFLTSTPLQ
jgi:hypothetical protein